MTRAGGPAPAADTIAKDAAKGRRIAVVAARFNAHITEKLVDGALEVIARAGAKRRAVLWVPGALELPLAALRVIQAKKPDAVICIGCVIEGDTDHYHHVASAASNGVTQVALSTGVVVTNAILTVKNEQQALDRAGGKVGNKGAEAAIAAIETLSAFDVLE